VPLALKVGAVVIAIAAAMAVIMIGNIQYLEQPRRFLPSATLRAISIGMLALGIVSNR
jgi:hypothetical protein